MMFGFDRVSELLDRVSDSSLVDDDIVRDVPAPLAVRHFLAPG